MIILHENVSAVLTDDLVFHICQPLIKIILEKVLMQLIVF